MAGYAAAGGGGFDMRDSGFEVGVKLGLGNQAGMADAITCAKKLPPLDGNIAE
jgi:hypothetical protein